MGSALSVEHDAQPFQAVDIGKAVTSTRVKNDVVFPEFVLNWAITSADIVNNYTSSQSGVRVACAIVLQVDLDVTSPPSAPS